MNSPTPWLIVTIAVAIIAFAIIAVIIRKEKGFKTDYKALFNMGIIFFAIGLLLKNYIMSTLGIIFFIAGALNKNKWKKQTEPTPIQKKFTIIVLVIGILLLLIMTVKYYLKIN